MNRYTVNVYSNEWSRQNEIDIEFRVGTGGFGSDVQNDITDIKWKPSGSKMPLSRLSRTDGVDLIVLNLQETCRTLHCSDDTEILISKDVTNKYQKYSFQHKGKEVAVVSHMTGTYVNDRRYRNVLSAFKEKVNVVS